MEAQWGSLKTPLEFILDYGLYGILVIIIILIVHNPERVTQFKAIVLSPLYRIFKIGGKQYIAAKICYTVTHFLRRQLPGVCRLPATCKIKLRWVTRSSDPVLHRSGSIILRMKDSEDQSRNLINAARQALPLVVCPAIRGNLGDHFQTAIDLTVLRKLANRIGAHGKITFQKHFLRPEISADGRVAELFEKLVEIDTRGIFVTVFLSELEYAGECMYGQGDAKDRTSEIEELLEYLLTVARRRVGQHIELEYNSHIFNLAIIIIAIDAKARREGVVPYINRIDINVRKGCERIYLVAYWRQLSFLDKVLGVVEGDARVTIVNRMKVTYLSEIDHNTEANLGVALLRRNAVVQDDDFSDKLKVSGIKVGDIVTGTVVDVAEKKATVDVAGLLAVIGWQECAWGVTNLCTDFLRAGDTYDFLVTNVDEGKKRIELTRRLPTSDPWTKTPVPEVGETVSAVIQSRRVTDLVGHTTAGLQVIIPRDEVSWMPCTQSALDSLIGQEVEAKLIECDQENRVLRCSIRQILEDTWPLVEKHFPRGTRLRGKVVEINHNNVRVELDHSHSIVGVLSRDELTRAGFEFAAFNETFVIGQGLDVVVTGLHRRRRRIRLGLQRNR